MSLLKSLSKDHLGALLLVALGAATLVMGLGYRMGNLNRMGAGFIPVVLGGLLIAVGILIGATDSAPGQAMMNPLPGDGRHSGAPEWRGWICILGGVIAFVALGHWGGLVPATFASVFVAALGDRQNNWLASAGLAAVVTVLCVIVFHVGLNIQLPLFQWGG